VKRALWKNGLYFASMVAILVFANWARSGDVRAIFLCCPGGLTAYNVEGTLLNTGTDEVKILDTKGQTIAIPRDQLRGMEEVNRASLYERIYHSKWILVALLLGGFATMVYFWFSKDEIGEWVSASWGYAKLILPLLLFGVLVAGFLLGRPSHEGLIPTEWVNRAVGGNSLRANLFAAVAGAFMYFATLTEVPILQGLMGAGMGKGPALALLLAGPALSLPNMLVIRSVMGTQKTIVFVILVVVMATISGIVFGALF